MEPIFEKTERSRRIFSAALSSAVSRLHTRRPQQRPWSRRLQTFSLESSMSKTLSRVGLVAALLVGPQQVCCARWTATSASGNGQAATSFVSVSTSTPFLPRFFQRARAMAQSKNVGTTPRVPKMKAAGGRSVNGERQPLAATALPSVAKTAAVHAGGSCTPNSCSMLCRMCLAGLLVASIYPRECVRLSLFTSAGLVSVCRAQQGGILCKIALPCRGSAVI